MWTELIMALIGLLGVLIGAQITIHSQRVERRQARYREQLDSFYSHMLAWRSLIEAKGRTRIRITGAADPVWRDLVAHTGSDYDRSVKLSAERGPDFQRIFDETNRIFKEEIFPLYQKMVSHFTEHFSLAMPSTQEHFYELVEFVEIWESWLKKTIPPEVLREIGHTEEKLLPLYEDLRNQTKRLQALLMK